MSMRPDRALIVSCRNTLVQPHGAAEYLAGCARSLAQAGFEVSIIFVEELPDRMARVRIVPRYRRLFAHYRMFRTLHFRGYHYSVNLRKWLRLLVRRAGLSRFFGSVETSGAYGLELNPPTDAARRWAGAIMRDLKPAIVVANHFNAAEVFPETPAGTAKAILLHDVLALRRESFEAAGAEIDFDPLHIAKEEAVVAKADICFAIKEEEAAFVRRLAPRTEVVTLPVLVEIGDCDLQGERAPVCIFVGGDNACNRDALGWFLSEVWPQVIRVRPGARFHIVGAAGNCVARPYPDGVRVLGFVSDLQKEYGRAAVAVTPVLFGSGVKIKLIEGLAAGLPSVATSVGAEGVMSAPSEILRIEDSAEGFAGAILSFFATPDAGKLRTIVREFARAHYDQATVGRDIINRLVDRGCIPSVRQVDTSK